MEIIELRVNHIKEPLGFNFEKLHFSYKVLNAKGKKQIAAQIEVSLDKDFNLLIMDTGRSEKIKSNFYDHQLRLNPMTRYFWRVTVWSDEEEVATSEISWFEAGKQDERWTAEWITSTLNQNIHPVIWKEVIVDKKIKEARLYICGLGVYETYINKEKVGNEYLAPGNNDYNKWIQYQTYDITESLTHGNNVIEVILGDGWYKGNFGFNGGMNNIFGDTYALIAEVHIIFSDNSKEILVTDETWSSYESKVRDSSIYNGEVLDLTFTPEKIYGVRKLELSKDLLTERLGVPVIVKEEVIPVELIKTPAGETVIDMGQNMVGWLKFKNTLPKGSKLIFQHGEILQGGNFYRENLRHAKAEFVFTSDGIEGWIRPHFTFFGFRYVKITGWNAEIDLKNFIGEVVYSDLEMIGEVKTSNSKVNQLFSNALWGQKGNFLDIPTDCPQRDERMGWTGDAQVFSATAAYNMNVYPFFTKFTHDLWLEQKELDGAVPMIIPVIPNPSMPSNNITSSGWSDAATIIPWNMYLFSGDKSILESQFESMRGWVDYISKKSGDSYLWHEGFHFGDWLALDGENPKAPNGGTDPYFVASAYYYYSTTIVEKAAKVIGNKSNAEHYGELANEIKYAIQKEYISDNGKLTIDKQAAYVLTLYMGLCRDEHKERVARDLANRIKKDDNHIKTGFIGTPYICKVLSEFGYNDLAYTLLLNEEFPSWLYAINLGATTIWERWNSVLPDGTMNPQGMNSLNHYAYGSIVEWMYSYMVGIRPDEKCPGFKNAIISPKPNWQIKQAEGTVNTASGKYKVKWEILNSGKLEINIDIPFNATATVKLPDARVNDFDIEDARQVNDDVVIELSAGRYSFYYMPTKEYIRSFDGSTTLKTLLETPSVKNIIANILPQIINIKPYKLPIYSSKSLEELKNIEELKIDEKALNEVIRQFKLL
ncbi:alpha-L-rhamnosidase [Clostridium sp. YIM B02506]|uniref:alpha-L-rhamnosidase n=1 Tax=Clostridium sp. YIM B02506 TaxID=2910680 RepID=UPI001EEE1F30|nr:alpha-L-rhamnosidase [Clostridium sp. YIM B02506]